MEYQLLTIIKCQANFELYDNSESTCYTTLEIFSANKLGRLVIIHFREAAINVARVIESKDNVTINMPYRYFERLYPLFQDAFYHQKYSVKMTTILDQYKKWYPQFEFIPK